MSNNAIEQPDVNINSSKTISAAIYLSIVGAAVFIVQPGFVQGMVEHLHFSEKQAGFIASIEMWGLAITTLLLSFISHKVNWRRILYLSSAVLVVANLLSTTTDNPTLFAFYRCIVGLGSGTFVSLTSTIIGLTNNPDRNYGYGIMWILIYGAIGFVLMPYAYNAFGMNGVLLFFTTLGFTGFAVIHHLPLSNQQQGMNRTNNSEISASFKAFAIVCMLIYFIAQAIVWAYLFLIGTNSGISEQSVANALTVSQFTGIAGALFTALTGVRFGRILPLVIGILISVISLLCLYDDISSQTYLIAVCLFNFAWNMTHPFLLASMASFDQTGRVVARAVSAQMIGIAIGPAIAALIISPNNYNGVLNVGILLFIVSLAFILPPLIKQKKIENPV